MKVKLSKIYVQNISTKLSFNNYKRILKNTIINFAKKWINQQLMDLTFIVSKIANQ